MVFKRPVFDCTYFHLWVGPICPQILISICGHFGPSADTLDLLDGSNMSADSYFHLRTFWILWMGPICPQIHNGSLINRDIVMQI